MELKTYQEETLEKLRKFLHCLADAKGNSSEKQQDLQEYPDLLEELANFPKRAWKKYGQEEEWVSRKDEGGQPIPHVCLKLPTGGGKTLLGAEALAPIHRDYLGKNKGLVLWMVPSNAIFEQTKKALADRNHPYRQRIEYAFGGNVQLFTKEQRLSLLDVESKLCVMLMMVQASYRSTKDFLKIFRTNEKYDSFFPGGGDYHAMNALLRDSPDLELDESEYAEFPGVSIKRSLVNVFKLCRPVIIMDEGHKTYSPLARKGISKFNPSFVLELTATPAENMSNILVDVKGQELHDEEMIKLPIEVNSTRATEWKETLKQACKKREELERQAKKFENKSGRYIRPIMLIRAERTGKEQRDGYHIHSEDVKEYLQKIEGVPTNQIAIKTATLDDLKDIPPDDGGLLSPKSFIRYIITKNALQEGWDCPFAYVLTLLDNTTAHTPLVQMVGRILRQPQTRRTGNKALDSAYVFCHNKDAGKLVEDVSEGLAKEGMKDLRRYIMDMSKDDLKGKYQIRRRKRFNDLRILLPKVLINRNGKFDELDYEADLLSQVPWHKLQADCPPPKSLKNPTTERVRVGLQGQEKLTRTTRIYEIKNTMEFFCRQLSDIVPNPWQTARIIGELFKKWAVMDEKEIYIKRYAIVRAVARSLKQQIDKITKEIFLTGLKDEKILFKIIATDERLHHRVAEKLIAPAKEQNALLRRGGAPLQKSLFEENYEDAYNNFEKKVALYLDTQEAVDWWWRMASRRDYALQGWQKDKIYPDFLFCLDKQGTVTKELAVAETRGEHLDSTYKKELMKTLEEHQQVGEFELITDERHMEDPQKIKSSLKLPLIFQNNWKFTIDEMIAS